MSVRNASALMPAPPVSSSNDRQMEFIGFMILFGLNKPVIPLITTTLQKVPSIAAFYGAPVKSVQFLECGNLSPLWPLGRLVGPAEPRFSGSQTTLDSDGDKSPDKSGDNSPHSR